MFALHILCAAGYFFCRMPCRQQPEVDARGKEKAAELLPPLREVRWFGLRLFATGAWATAGWLAGLAVVAVWTTAGFASLVSWAAMRRTAAWCAVVAGWPSTLRRLGRAEIRG